MKIAEDPEDRQTFRVAFEQGLARLAPIGVCRELGFSKKVPWARVFERAVIWRAATGDARAAKEIREAVEGRLPRTIANCGKIDYKAGEEAKRILLEGLDLN